MDAERQVKFAKNREKALKIFGKKYEEKQQSEGEDPDQNEVLDTEQIDDPFTSEIDKKIAQTDVPERLAVKLQGRYNVQEDELV